MTNRSIPHSPAGPSRLVPLVGVLLTMASVCPLMETPLAAQSTGKQQPPPAQVPGIPNLPDVVTVVPFHMHGNYEESTKILIPAEVAGRRGMFILDTGDPQVDVNRDYVKPNAAGGLDTVAAGESVAQEGEALFKATVRIGTLQTPEPVVGTANHAFGGYGILAPRLGNIGLDALEPFETIIDYTHQRLILIRLDSAGHRMATVPAYTPTSTVPLVRTKSQTHWGIEGRIGAVTDTMLLDTGQPFALMVMGNAASAMGDHLKADTLDHLTVGNRTFDALFCAAIPGFAPYASVLAGYDFLKLYGVVGFNFRTRQLILYR